MNDKTTELEANAGREASECSALYGALELVVDPIDEALEEISAIAAAWQKNRDRKRPSPILRRALIHAAQELVDEVDMFHKRQADEAKAKAI